MWSRTGRRPSGVRKFAAGATLLLQLISSGCRKRQPSPSDLREITHELVAAAQLATGRRAEIAIRPEITTVSGGSARLTTDHVFVTIGEPAERAELEHALDQVAKNHGLVRRGESFAVGVTRIDYALGGRTTHVIHLITRYVASPPPGSALASKGARLAIILDDLGYDRAAVDALLGLPHPLTVSVLPNLPLSTEIAEEVHRRGYQVMLHLPMASNGGDAKPEAIELRPGMTAGEVSEAVAAMLATVPYAAGVNNHQGSLATADATLMAELMPALREHRLFFVDSRTTIETVAYDAAEHAGVRAAFRNVFLDDVLTKPAVLAQLKLAERDAIRLGWAIAIGHPHPATIAALAQALPKLEADGIRLVFVSDLVR